MNGTISRGLPLFVAGKVVRGFGRGSKQLGIPTANFPEMVVDDLPTDLDCGIYYGWASINHGPVHKMVMSIGWNPYYGNTKKSMETHIIHEFQEDFYDALLKVVVLGYIRPEKNFDNVDSLIATIRNDIAQADSLLERAEHRNFPTHPFFKEKNGHVVPNPCQNL